MFALAAMAAEPDYMAMARRHGQLSVELREDGVALVDERGHGVAPEVALALLGEPEAAARYRARRIVRRAGGVMMFITIPAVSTLSGVLVNELTESTPATMIAVLAPAGVLVGGGVAVLNSPDKRLKYWMPARVVRDRVARYNHAIDHEGIGPALLRLEHPVMPWVVDGEGRVVDAAGKPVSTQRLAEALGDEDVAFSARAERRLSRAMWVGVTTAGAGILLGGLGMAAWSEEDPAIGLASGSVGAAMVVGGAVGISQVGQRDRASDWFDAETIQEAVEKHNAGGPVSTLGLAEPRPPPVQVRPVIGVGYLGVQGTF